MGPIGSITPEAFTTSHDVNLRGPVFLVQHALPHLSADASSFMTGQVLVTGRRDDDVLRSSPTPSEKP